MINTYMRRYTTRQWSRFSSVSSSTWDMCANLGQVGPIGVYPRLTIVAFASLAEFETNIRCADGFTRRYHPIMGGMMVDYEEQVLITGIKKNRHCSICRVRPNERGDLLKKWQYRTHDYTQAKLVSQRSARKRIEDGLAKDTMAVHPVRNWAWRHKHCNIHMLMDVDILHQLLKGVVIRLIDWCTALIDDVIGTNPNAVRRTKKQGKKKVSESTASIRLDGRSRQVPGFTGLKLFDHFSKVKQWSGNEPKAIVRQLVAVTTPLLAGKRDFAIHCCRAIIDFVMLAMYESHDEHTLSYLEEAIYRIHHLKTVFAQYRPQYTTLDGDNEDESQFNIPKLHIITHYADFIRLYGSAQSFDTAYGEAAHKFLLKSYYRRINKTEGWEHQILAHVVRHDKLRAMNDRLFYGKSTAASSATQDIGAMISRAAVSQLTDFPKELASGTPTSFGGAPVLAEAMKLLAS